MTAKIVNYTPEQTSRAVSKYKASPTAETVAALASEFGKTVKSVVAKLSREGVYMKAERKTKTGAPVVSKEMFVAKIAEAVNVNAEKLDGLEKAPKAALTLILKALHEQLDSIEAMEAAEAEKAAEAEGSEG